MQTGQWMLGVGSNRKNAHVPFFHSLVITHRIPQKLIDIVGVRPDAVLAADIVFVLRIESVTVSFTCLKIPK
jgi:hypothetical protein